MKIRFKEARKGGETNEIQPIMVDFQTYDQGEYQEEDNPGCAKGEQSNTKRSGYATSHGVYYTEEIKQTWSAINLVEGWEILVMDLPAVVKMGSSMVECEVSVIIS